MMKSFFKKLAFVMALAMVVSMAAPAAKTVAAAEDKKPLAIAYQKGAVITALNLVEVGATEDLRFVYAPANWKDLEVKWESSNEDVVAVDESGVVEAKAEGTATVTVTVGDETASVEVYSVETATFVATMGNAEDRAMTELTLTVGEEFDFAFYGIKDYSMDIYRCDWFAVDPDGVLDFDETNGKLVAKKAGSAKISLGVMNLKTGIKTDVAPCVVTVEEEKAPVDPNNFEVTKMISDSSFELTFEDTALTAEEIKANLTTDYYVGDVRVTYNNIKNVEVKDGVAKVQFYSVVGDNVTYVFSFKGVEKEFTTEIGKPVSMYLTWRDEKTYTGNVAWAGYTTIFVPHILNENGTEITASVLNNTLGKVVEYELVDAAATAQYWLTTNGGIYFAAANANAAVKATFWDGYNNAGERVKAAVSPVTVVTSSDKPLYGFPYQTASDATIKGTYNWITTNFAVNDDRNGADYIWMKLVDSNGWTQEVKGGTALTFSSEDKQQGIITGKFSFASDNMNIFTVSADGEVKANTPGKANILVYYDPNINNYTDTDKYLVAVVPVTTFAERKVTTVSVDKNFSAVSTYAGNNGNRFDQVTFKIYLKDQLGEAINLGTYDTLDVYQLPVTLTTQEPVVTFNAIPTLSSNTGEYHVTFTCAEGTLSDGATRQLSYGINFNNAQRQVISVSAVNPITDNVDINASSYTVSVSSDDHHNDLNTFWYNSVTTDKLTVKLYEQRNGVKYHQMQFAGLLTNAVYANPVAAQMNAYYLKVAKDGVDVTQALVNNVAACSISGDSYKGYTTVSVDTRQVEVASGRFIDVIDKNLGAGTYTVMAYKAVGNHTAASPSAFSLVAQKNITITDSSAKVEYFKKNSDLVYGTTDVIAIAKAAFEVKHGYTVLNNANTWQKVEMTADYTWINANTVFYRSITIYVPSNGTNGNSTKYVPYTITVNDYVRAQ